MRPKVSIITPTFNSAAYIKETYKSILAQDFDEWEWLVTDDCSADSSFNLIREFAAEDSRVKVDRLHQNSGAAVARNASIARSSGRYIAFLDADDLWKPTKLSRQLDYMQKNSYAFTHTWYRRMSADGVEFGPVVEAPEKLAYEDMLKSNRVGCLTAIYDSHSLGKVFMPLIRKRQDYGLWLKILKIISYAYCLPECLASYREVSGSISSNKLEMLGYNWQLYRQVERLSYAKSIYYLWWNIVRKIIR